MHYIVRGEISKSINDNRVILAFGNNIFFMGTKTSMPDAKATV